VPYLRGYGGTRFVDEATPRSGQQAALGHDLRDLIDALALDRPVVAGYDWGGRAACVVSALWPEKVSGLVTANGYNIQDIAAAAHPQSPDAERRLWYQYYFHGGRGAAGLAKYRDDLARALWREWSPSWAFTESELRASTASFANPDFVEVVIHSYRHRFGLVAGDPAYEHTEQQLAAQPQITVPTVVLDGDTDGVTPPRELSEHEPQFTALVDYRRLPGIGHNVPQEASAEFARAVTALL
jgi:pimeloyl-ACP methyl ester carboxylesterase